MNYSNKPQMRNPTFKNYQKFLVIKIQQFKTWDFLLRNNLTLYWPGFSETGKAREAESSPPPVYVPYLKANDHQILWYHTTTKALP